MAEELDQHKTDIRIYIAILFFRWKTVAIVLLYSLLIAVLYLNLAPKSYQSSCKLLLHRDPMLQLKSDTSPWSSLTSHMFLLRGEKLRRRAATGLLKTWGGEMGGLAGMVLPVNVTPVRGFGTMIDITVKCGSRAYGEAFLNALVDEHRAEWHSIQMEHSTSAARLLEEELRRLEEQIRVAEDDLIEYARLNDIARVEAKGSSESRYLMALMERKNMLTTELMLLEAQYPRLKDAGAGMIIDVERLTRETGAVEPMVLRRDVDMPDGASASDLPEEALSKPKLPAELSGEAPIEDRQKELTGLYELKYRLDELAARDRELSANLAAEHPQRKALAKEMDSLRQQLEAGARIAMERLQDRHKALLTHLNALEAAEYRWQSKNLLASKRQAEFNRIRNVVARYEGNYNTLYSRLHDMRVAEELKAEHFRLVEPVSSGAAPVWPDPVKILLAALAVGLGGGLGLALVIQVLDNKVQSISDVEGVLKIPFLGGVPYWAHSDLERTVRPIVTEQHSAGAVEAYRALRTAVLSALQRENEKILVITSADSREGKTLTTLNLAIMTAQMGKKVLLVDMDLRRGRIHRSLALTKSPGFTEVLAGSATLASAVQATRIDNLSVIACGEPVDTCGELLHATDLKALFASVLTDFDYVFIDSSPVLRVADTGIVVSQGLGVVAYVARVNHTPKPMIKYSLDMLENARVIGLIMNSIELHRISSLYYSYLYPNYGYYSNAYEYGVGYYDNEGGTGSRRRVRRADSTVSARLLRWFNRTFLPME